MAEERDDKKRGRTWEKEETIILLEKWGEENVQQRLKECSRKKPIWQEISTYLNASGYDDRDCDSCKTRIHTLISAYRGYKDASSRSGNATPKKKAPFFDEINEILSDKPATRPVIVLSSTVLESAQSKETELTDDEKSQQPSCSFPTLEKNHLPSPLAKDKQPAQKKRKTTQQDVLKKIDDSLKSFMEYQQQADRLFLEAERERERKEEEREEKRRKEDQEFFLKLAKVLKG
ncbi:Zinc finger and SCAN domain-containing protein 29 [Acropora cervicornis]|uniref:Zinc finger and SCAN domain-containing protein 29 n=1 Tax=Acropora cervicornis TaxID=6130 RepID=A0AAD9QNW2_ACRCE|nr:Zinc finger and SCAN domain-containing protein 29 [Acropora cervicornis]